MHWACLSQAAPWAVRSRFGVAALPSGTVLLLGGLVGPRNDVWRSSDGGLRWELLADSAPWPARWGPGVAVLPRGAVLLLGGISSSGGDLNDIWLSEDQGLSWERLVQAAPWSARVGHGVAALAGGALLLAGGLRVAGGPLNDVWRSLDGGATWEKLPEAPWCKRCWFGLAALSSGAALVLGGLGAGNRLLGDVWRTGDGGQSWEQVLEAAPWKPRRGLGVAALPSGTLLVLGGLAASGALNDVWCSSDGGASWEEPSEAPHWPPRIDPGVAVLPSGAVLLLGGQDRSVDGNRNDVWRADPECVGVVAEGCAGTPAAEGSPCSPCSTGFGFAWPSPSEYSLPKMFGTRSPLPSGGSPATPSSIVWKDKSDMSIASEPPMSPAPIPRPQIRSPGTGAEPSPPMMQPKAAVTRPEIESPAFWLHEARSISVPRVQDDRDAEWERQLGGSCLCTRDALKPFNNFVGGLPASWLSLSPGKETRSPSRSVTKISM